MVFGRPGHVIWPSELVPGARQVDVTLESDRARAGLRVMYTAPGGSWDASYRLFTGARSRFEGVATVSAGPLDLPDAAVQLLAGDIGNYGRSPRPIAYAKMAEARAAMAVNTPSVESVGEAHLYTLPVAVSFMPGMELVVPLFDPVAVQTERRYVVPGALSYYGGIGAGRDEQTVPVEVSYHLAHAHGTPFGDLPLPAGTVSVFAADRRGAMQLVGRGNIDHTAAGEDLDIDAGTAFDITAKRAQIEYALTKIANPQGGATEAKISYRVTIQNAKDSAVTVAVREDRSGDWAVITSSIPARKVSSTRQVFMVPVPPKGTTVLTYTVRVTW